MVLSVPHLVSEKTQGFTGVPILEESEKNVTVLFFLIINLTIPLPLKK
jgi:hypothetical protein